MRLVTPSGSNDASWLALRRELWPDASEREHLDEMSSLVTRALRFETERVAYFVKRLDDK